MNILMRQLAPCVLLLLAAGAPVNAATISVPCSVPALVSAINTANANDQEDVIDLAAGCTYTLTEVDNEDSPPVAPDAPSGPNGLPVVMTSHALAIHGHGATVARSSAPGTPDFRLLDVLMSPGVDTGGLPQFMLDELSLRNGKATDTSEGYSALGAGLLIRGFQAAGLVVLDRLSLIGNQSFAGGGLMQTCGGLVELHNSTISGNVSQLYGGGIGATNGSLAITSSRIVNNQQGYPQLIADSSNAYVISGGGGVASNFAELLTIADSEVSGNSAWGLGGGGVGAIATSGYMVNTRVHDNINHVPDNVNTSLGVEFGGGGGVALGNFSSTGEQTSFTIQRSAIYDNTAEGSAGGIGLAGNVSSAINNTTVSGNVAAVRGGGIGNAASLMLLANATVANNAASRGAGLDIGSYKDLTQSTTVGEAWFMNSVIADNTGATDCYNDGGSVSDNASSLLETDATGINACDGASGKSFKLRGDPKLSTLAAHGGPDPSHMPQAGSPLIDAGTEGWNSSPHDQRGTCFARLRGSAFDIGAIETGNEEVIFCAKFDPSTISS